MKQFGNRVAFVTGGASGIGYGLVRNFLDLGMRVVVADASAAHLEEVRASHAGCRELHCLRVDVADREQMRAAAAETLRVFGKVHVLCNNAGVGGGGDVADPDFDDWDRALAVNLGGVVNGCKLFVPPILAHGEGGHIVNTASMAGIVPLPLPGLGCYQTAKFAVRGLTESLRMALAPHGIGVSCLFPGGTRTRIIEAGAKDDAGRTAARAMTASWMDPIELGAMVVDGIRRNAPYILTHVEFRDEVRDMGALLDAAFPRQQDMPAERRAFEEGRRAMIRERCAMPVKD